MRNDTVLLYLICVTCKERACEGCIIRRDKERAKEKMK